MGEMEKKPGVLPDPRDVIQELDRNLNPSIGDPWNFIPSVHKQKFKGNRKGKRICEIVERQYERNKARLAKLDT